ncbi:MAG TPA: phosphatase PAP2 family protein [Thermoanaerobaculia bacterium]
MVGGRVGNRRVVRRPYFFEIFIFVNLVVAVLVTRHLRPVVLTNIPTSFVELLPQIVIPGVVGVAISLAVAAFRGKAASYLRVIRSRGWLVDTARMIIATILTSHIYFWIKLLVPILHHRDFDQFFWNLDQSLFFGFAPALLFADLFSHPVAMRAIDWSYGRIFSYSFTLAFMYFLSAPSRRVRMAFMSGSAILWLAGAWLYLAVPTLGPALRFPELWSAYASSMPSTTYLQTMLMDNYRKVLLWQQGASVGVHSMLGVGAFPSLHVGFQTYVFLWMRRLWTFGEIVFGIFVVTILIGSVVTGWHYLIDGIAGAVLALLAYLVAARWWRTREFFRLRGATR